MTAPIRTQIGYAGWPDGTNYTWHRRIDGLWHSNSNRPTAELTECCVVHQLWRHVDGVCISCATGLELAATVDKRAWRVAIQSEVKGTRA